MSWPSNGAWYNLRMPSTPHYLKPESPDPFSVSSILRAVYARPNRDPNPFQPVSMGARMGGTGDGRPARMPRESIVAYGRRVAAWKALKRPLPKPPSPKISPYNQRRLEHEQNKRADALLMEGHQQRLQERSLEYGPPAPPSPDDRRPMWEVMGIDPNTPIRPPGYFVTAP